MRRYKTCLALSHSSQGSPLLGSTYPPTTSDLYGPNNSTFHLSFKTVSLWLQIYRCSPVSLVVTIYPATRSVKREMRGFYRLASRLNCPVMMGRSLHLSTSALPRFSQCVDSLARMLGAVNPRRLLRTYSVPCASRLRLTGFCEAMKQLWQERWGK